MDLLTLKRKISKHPELFWFQVSEIPALIRTFQHFDRHVPLAGTQRKADADALQPVIKFADTTHPYFASVYVQDYLNYLGEPIYIWLWYERARLPEIENYPVALQLHDTSRFHDTECDRFVAFVLPIVSLRLKKYVSRLLSQVFTAEIAAYINAFYSK